ncbi:DegT/DnrJ/EryC1/StrS family aminotransferase [Paraglaciecola polaris]|uniref:DegT/DnrJ/EryC1/StrS family aminotransferase n=1 Tax=Paraglaciecola polaris TaxID=222814 RepID=UPI0030EB7799|tara:strand:+ start:6127 stop:7251 length:1125 start_codon:yes stop_codon:yes gene_type:complete
MKPSLIRLSKSVVGEREAKAVSEVILNDGYLGMGKEVKRFEERLELMFNRHCIAVNSGTAALHLAIESIIQPGDEVLVPSITYVATYQAVTAAGGIPISCDVIHRDMSIDLCDAKSKITSKTRVIVPVFYSGSGRCLDSIEAFAKQHDLRVVYDAAHAFGSSQGGQLIGRVGDVFCFSFDGIKNITCGEGGAVVTQDDNIASYCRDARLLGVKNDTQARYEGKRSWAFDVHGPGYRYHMSNINAAIGNVQLDRFKDFAIQRQRLAEEYVNLLQNKKYISLLDIDFTDTVPHIFAIVLDKNVDRDEIKRKMLEKGVETGVHYFANHKLSRFKTDNNNCKVAEQIHTQLLSLPLHPELNEESLSYVVHQLIELLGD